MLEQRNYNDANKYIDAALQLGFRSVRFPLTLADVAHRRGGPEGEGDRAALRSLSKVLGSAMNPEHELALTTMAALRAKNFGNIDRPAKWIQTVEEKKDSIGPVALANLAWASGEFALALGDAKLALEKAEEAIKSRADYPPYYSLKARAQVAQGKIKDAYATYEESFTKGPLYRGMKWEYAELKSRQGDDGALPVVAELEKSDPSSSLGPEYEIFRGEHYLKKDNLAEAKKAFTKAADMGDNPEILFGIAKVTYLEEKKRGNKANLERVAEVFGQASEARATFPELQEYMAEISLWNYQVDGAQGSFEEAEKQYKKLSRPVPELLAFYDRVVEAYDRVDKQIKKDADKLIPDWKKRKQDYLASVAALLQ
jgi:tetratricopeptide (TPR) repeat protein